MCDEQLRDYLRENGLGKGNIVRGKSLAKAFSISENELRRRVSRLRHRGVPIASCRNGYFHAETAGEVYMTIRSLRRMADGLEAAIGGLEHSLERFSGGAM